MTELTDREIELERANIIACRFWTSMILLAVIVVFIQWARGAMDNVQAQPAIAIPVATPSPLPSPTPFPTPSPTPIPSVPLDNLEELNYPPDPNPVRSA